MSERLKEAVLKTVELLRVPWVRIPLPPPSKIDHGELAELAEGARLLSEYTGLTCIEGSNPSLSAKK